VRNALPNHGNIPDTGSIALSEHIRLHEFNDKLWHLAGASRRIRGKD